MLDSRVWVAVFALAFYSAPGVSWGDGRVLARFQPTAKPVQASAPKVDPPLRLDRGAGFEPIRIPKDESLEYVVEIDLGILGDLRVGTVGLSSGVEPYPDPPSRPDPPSETSEKFAGWIRSEARGSYMGYRLKQVLDVRYRPQEWPTLLYTDIQTGSENRRHELRVGLREGQPTLQFDEDHHCHGCTNPEHFVESIWPWGKPYHCDGCKRMEHRAWDVSITRPTLPGTVDLLSAVYLARSMIEEGNEKETFPVLDQDKLWILTVRVGEKRAIDTPAGRFGCVLAELDTKVPQGEVRDKKDFAGLFGIQGTIRIWMQVATGVPVQISGDLPVPVIGRLVVNVRLTSFRGTPPEFASAH